jgi:hypothetical protein
MDNSELATLATLSHRILFPAILAIFLLFASNAEAIPIAWTLQGVRFDDGGVVAGTFTYDAATGFMSNWNMSVSGGNQNVFAPLTYSNANSTLLAGHGGIGFVFDHTVGHLRRDLRLFFQAPLTNGPGTAALNTTGGFSVECFNCGPFRSIVSGGAFSVMALAEPSTMLLLVSGLTALGYIRLRRIAT